MHPLLDSWLGWYVLSRDRLRLGNGLCLVDRNLRSQGILLEVESLLPALDDVEVGPFSRLMK